MTTTVAARHGSHPSRGPRSKTRIHPCGQGRPLPLITVTIREDSVKGTFQTGLKVDREKGIIYRVKVLGKESPNRHGIDDVDGTEYTLEALNGAVRLYENQKVNCDHPDRDKPHKDRSVYDRLGKLVNVRVEEGELYADLHLLKSHPMATRVMEAAEHMPDAFGLSHNADGRGEVRNKKYVILEIPEVRSVDLVADAGTTKSLFESKSREGKPMLSIRKVLEAALPKCHKTKKPLLKKLLEGCDDDPNMKKVMEEEMPVESEPVAADAAAVASDPTQALKDGFKAAMIAVLDDDTMDAAAKLKKLKDLLTTHEKLTEQPVEEPVAEADEEDETEVPESEEEETEEKVTESRRTKKRTDPKTRQLQEQLDQLQRKDQVRDECSAAGFSPNATQLKALVLLTESKERQELIESFAKTVRPSDRPRSQSPGHQGNNNSKPKFPNSREETKRLVSL